jgi:AcrR family transcriptional regulator
MKAEAARRTSHDESSQHKIAHHREPRDPRADIPGGTPEPRRDRRDARWDEHRRTRREQLVDAAVAAVGRHGAGVGMEEIAAAAGTSKTVVYRHFADRSDLHVAVCNRVAGQLLPKLREAMESSEEPREKVAAAIDTYLVFLEADPELYRFVVHGADRPTDRDPIDSLGRLVAEQAAGLVAAALRQAGRDDAAGTPWGHGLVGMVRAAADWWLAADRPMLRGVLAAHLTDLAWAGLSGVVPLTSPTSDIQAGPAEANKEEK